MRRLSIVLAVVTAVISAACGGADPQSESAGDATRPEQTDTASPEPSTEDTQIVYYYFLEDPEGDLPGGSAIMLPDILVLSPALTDPVPLTDTASGILTGLQAMIQDPRREWTSDDLQVTDVTCTEGCR